MHYDNLTDELILENPADQRNFILELLCIEDLDEFTLQSAVDSLDSPAERSICSHNQDRHVAMEFYPKRVPRHLSELVLDAVDVETDELEVDMEDKYER